MAIIYETKEDFERSKLKDQAKDHALKSASQGLTGMASVITASLVSDFNTKRTAGLRIISSVLNVVGAIEIVKSFFTAHKSHDLSLKRERMGPQKIVHPSGGAEKNEIPLMLMAESKSSSQKPQYLQGIEQKSLMEKAVNSDSVRQL